LVFDLGLLMPSANIAKLNPLQLKATMQYFNSKYSGRSLHLLFLKRKEKNVYIAYNPKHFYSKSTTVMYNM